MPIDIENLLFLMDYEFNFYCLQINNPVGIPKILVFSQWELEFRVQCSFRIGMEFQGIFHWSGFFPTFPVDRGSHRVCGRGILRF